MKATVISENKKRGTAMLTIVHDGISETRHCKRTPDGWQGYVLDGPKDTLLRLEGLSRAGSAELAAGGHPVKPYVANLLCVYRTEDPKARYDAHVLAEFSSARIIMERQYAEAVKMHAEQEIKRAAEAKKSRNAAAKRAA